MAKKGGASSFIFAFRSLPLILVISALSSLLFYWRVIPWIVKGFSLILTRIMGIGGVEGLGTAINVFVGMVEAPLIVRPYLLKVSKSEIFTIMTSGMATIAGTVMVLYASILNNVIPGVIGHLLVASIISAPAAITISKLMIPELGIPSGNGVEIPSGARVPQRNDQGYPSRGFSTHQHHCDARCFCCPCPPVQHALGSLARNAWRNTNISEAPPGISSHL